ncbi:CinA family protein [Natrialbaceae archaeon A-gly3]
MDEEIDLALAERVGEALREREATLAVAESCTGGLIGGALTAIPGSSDYFECGLTTYSYGTKRQFLGVSREALDDHGAVSGPVALEMARGVRDVADTTWGVATTGIAGPSGGTEENPVGTVYVAVAYAAPWESGDSYAIATRYEFDGDRPTVRAKTVERALADLEDELEGKAGPGEGR